MLDEIFEALTQSHPADRHQIKKYIAWLRLRRRVNDHFYFRAHWIANQSPGQPAGNAHWI